MKNLLSPKRIEFWILIFFLIRMVGITNPPIERGHNWRQSTGLMVARNFVEVDNNILYPRVDDNRGETGIIGMEFPLLNYLIYLVSVLFGYTHWYGRLINLIVTSIGIYFFYRMVAKFFTDKLAFTASLILIVSIWFSFARKTMPDTFCIALMFIALFYGFKYLEQGKYVNLILYLIFGSLGMLSKIPAGIYLIVLSFPILSVKIDLKRKIFLIVSTLIILFTSYWWYFTWNFHLAETYGNWYNSGKSLGEGFHDIISNIGTTLKRFYFSALQSYLLFALFLTGFFFMIRKKQKELMLVTSFVFAIFLIYIFKSGLYFYHHNYYIIPFVPVMALIAAYPLTLLKNKKVYIVLICLGIIESIANQNQDFLVKKKDKYKLELENIADSFSEKSDLIAINGNGNPQQIYLAHRKGWNLNNEELTNEELLNEIKLKGCKYLLINKKSYNIELNKDVVFTNKYYTAYKL